MIENFSRSYTAPKRSREIYVKSMATCTTVAIEIAHLCKVVIPMLMQRGNEFAQMCHFVSDYRGAKEIVTRCRRKNRLKFT